MALEAGARLGPYEVLGLVGAGGMGEVYRALDPRLGREVAVKILPAELSQRPDRLHRFEQEAKAVAALSHPHILTAFDIGSHDGTPYLVTELLEGRSLRDMLQHGPLPASKAVEFARQIADGLAAAHARGVVHRDLKPGNVFVTEDGRVKILDFGLAKLTEPGDGERGLEEASTRTGPGVMVGTVAYMSPEQVRGHEADPRSDIFALGAVLYEMLSGRRAFSGHTTADLVTAILTKDPERLSDPGLSVPAGVEQVVRRCLEKDRGERFQGAHDLALALEALRTASPGPSPLHVGERGPYPGLSAFTETDAGVFFGREEEVRTVWERIRGRRLLALIGPSGVGKSSLVRAGVIAGRPEGWGAACATPGAQPALGLARALTSELAGDAETMGDLLRGVTEVIGGGTPERVVAAVRRWRSRHAEALLVVDQFEELFTLSPGKTQEVFVALLGRLSSEADVHVLVSLRDDFLIRCSEHEALLCVFEALTPLSALTRDGLRRALVTPATKLGYRFEDESLVEEMVESVVGVRGALPLLAFAVSRLWERRDRERKLLTRRAYGEIGGVVGALAQHAEATMERIGSDHQTIVRELFRNLVTSQGTRAVMDRDELLSALPGREEAEEVLGELIDARLLTSYEVGEVEGRPAHHRIEIVHESLVKAWPRLVRWQTQDEEGALLRDQLKQAAHLWEEKGRTADLLWAGTSLREYEVWRERYPGALTALEEDYARAMGDRARKHRRVLGAAITAAFVALVGVAVAIGISRHQATTARDQARAEAVRAEASKLLALAQNRLADDPTEALAFTAASLRLADTQEARAFVMRTLWEAPPAVELDVGETMRTPSFSPAGRYVALGGNSPQVRVFSQGGGGPIVLSGHEHSPRGVNVALWVRDDLLATGLGVCCPGGIATRVHLWSIPGGACMRTIELGASSSWQVRQGALFAETVTTRPNTRSSITLRRWSLPDGAEKHLGTVDWTASLASSCAFAPDGSAWLYARGSGVYSRPLPLSEGQKVRLLARCPSDVTLYPLAAGPLVAVDQSGRSRSWPFSQAEEIASVSFGRDKPPKTIVRDPSARWLFDLDSQVETGLRLWSASAPSARPLVLRRSGSWYGSSFDFQSRGDWIAASTHASSRLTFWPLRRGYPIVLDGYTSWLGRPLAFSRDGRWLATSWGDSVLRLWPLSSGSPGAPRSLPLPGNQSVAWRGLSFDPEGRYVFAVGNEDQAWVVPLDGSRARKLPAFSKDTLIQEGAVSPSGRYVAWAFYYGRGDKTLRVWDIEAGRLRTFDLPETARPPEGTADSLRTGYEDGVRSLTFGDEATLYTAGDGGLYRWNLDTGSRYLERRRSPGPPVWGMSMAASGNGHTALIREGTGEAQCSSVTLLDLPGQTSRPLQGPSCGKAMALDPSGTVAVVSDEQGIVRAGRVDGEAHILAGHSGPVASVAISPDRRWVASAGEDGTLRLWPLPNLSEPPLHALPQAELLARLDSLTNLRAVRDSSSATGWTIDLGPFPGWKNLPTW